MQTKHIGCRGLTAVVTGASSGIGKAISLRLLSAGARVCVISRNLKSLEHFAQADAAGGDRVRCYQADLVIDEDIRRVVECLHQDLHMIDILVHSAGTIHFGPLESAPVEDFDNQYRCNVRAPYLLTQSVLPMLRKRQGQIVFINSSIVTNVRAGVGQFSATQHALKAMADCLRQEVNADGVRVLSVFPGRTATPRQAAIYQMEGRTYQPELLLQPEDIAEAVVGALSLPRTAEVTDLHLRPLKRI